MDILSALKKVTTSIKTWVDGKLDTKLDKNLGVDNAGKVLTIGDDGSVESQILDTGIIVLSGTDDNPVNIDEIKASGTYLIKGVITTSMDTTSNTDIAKLNKIFIDGFACGELMSVYSLQDGFINQFMMNPTRPLVRLDSGIGYSDAVDASYIQPVEKTTEMTQPVGIRRDGQLFTKPFNQVQSDWNQSDENAPDYIKNRTHYINVKKIVYKSETTLSFLSSGGVYVASYTLDDFDYNNKKICVVWDGIEYICDYINENENGAYAFGDINFVKCPFYFWAHYGYGSVKTNSAGDHTFTLYLYEENIKTIDPRMLPLAQTTGDSATLLMHQKAVTESLQSIKPKSATITLLAADWVGDIAPYSQVITIDGITANSKIDLQPTALQLAELQDAEITLMIVNDNSVTTAYAINNKPIKDYEMQVLITEVSSS